MVSAANGSQRTDLPTPTPAQLMWQDMELGMFFHFDIIVYKPDWNWRTWKDLPSSALYNPYRLNTDQWMEAAQAMGAKYAVLVAKHCSGFLQWQSDLYPYGVKQSPWRDGKGDLVADFVASCHKYGIKPGIYASVTANAYLEVDNPGLVNRGKGGDAQKQAEYVRICERMLTELWSRYGELTEIWFDGGALPPDKGGPDMLPLLQQYQPNALIFQGPHANLRWIGNEQGVADYPCWATVTNRKTLEAAEHGNPQLLGSGDPAGELWVPGECDVPIRNHEWFWRPNEEHKLWKLDQLIDKYYKSVGRNANLLINANPTPDGLVPEADFERYAQFGAEIRRRFSRPLAETTGEGYAVELPLGDVTIVDHVVIMEDIAHGERVRRYTVEAQAADGEWRQVCDGTSIGHKRIQEFEPFATSRLRWICTEAVAVPKIRKLAAYRVH
jgi:alpha-L-fucosidase